MFDFHWVNDWDFGVGFWSVWTWMSVILWRDDVYVNSALCIYMFHML